MKARIVLTLTAAALALSGCENLCEEASLVDGALGVAQSNVAQVLEDSEKLNNACSTGYSGATDTLIEASQFVARVAAEKFYREERNCEEWHVDPSCAAAERRDGAYSVRGRLGRLSCDEFVCDRYTVTPHKLPGYDEAIKLSQDLDRLAGRLELACTAYEQKDFANMVAILLQAKKEFESTRQDLTLLRQRAGCFKRRGG